MIEWVRKKNEYFFLIIGGEVDVFEENVRYISYLSDKSIIAKYLSAADVFIMPSLQEVFGLVAAESMACGTPVVGFNTGGIPEIIDHKISGYTSKCHDFGDLIKGVEYICNLEFSEYEKMSDKAKFRVKENFGKKKMIESYSKIYGSLI